MPQTFEFNGQLVTMTDGEFRSTLQRLIREVRVNVWLKSSMPFILKHDRWLWHYRERGHPIHWIIEAVGGADLPSTTTANSLKRRHDRLERLLNPTGIVTFFDRFDQWQREAARFRSAMRNYLNDFDAGGGISVRVLTVTRDGSFITLGLCAALLSGGATLSASAAAAAATEGAAAALVRSAATSFVIKEIKNGATRLGRTLAGETVTVEDTLREIGGSALSSVSDAMLGGIIGRFIAPLKSQLTAGAMREIRSGRLASGVAVELTNSQIVSAIVRAINNLSPADLRFALRDTPQARSERECAQSTSRHLMANRNFRRQLDRNLQAEAR